MRFTIISITFVHNHDASAFFKIFIMLLLTVTEFRSNISKYLKLASSERVALKSPSGIFEIVPSKEIKINPSPSKDVWFDEPRNMESVEKGIADVEAGRLRNWDDVKKELGL